jgi:RNA polymerase sigma-70 factor (ECF subfamily)
MEEKQLIEKAKLGDKSAIELLYRSNFVFIYKYVKSSLSDKDITDDVVSNIFVNAFSKIQSFRADSTFKTWLHMIARNEIYQQYKKNGVERKFLIIDENFLSSSEDENLGDEVEYEIKRELKEVAEEKKIELLLEKLNVRYAEVLRLRYLLSLNIKECAEILSITENNVKVLQNRALKQASKLLGEENGKDY